MIINLFHNPELQFVDSENKPHRDKGPASVFANGLKKYYRHGKLHRLDGRAVNGPNHYPQWWIDGEQYDYDDYWLAASHLLAGQDFGSEKKSLANWLDENGFNIHAIKIRELIQREAEAEKAREEAEKAWEEAEKAREEASRLEEQVNRKKNREAIKEAGYPTIAAAKRAGFYVLIKSDTSIYKEYINLPTGLVLGRGRTGNDARSELEWCRRGFHVKKSVRPYVRRIVYGSTYDYYAPWQVVPICIAEGIDIALKAGYEFQYEEFLILADWLEENGEPALADIIRKQPNPG